MTQEFMTTTNLSSPRRSRPARRHPALVFALLAIVSLSACGGADEDGDQAAGGPDASTSPPSPSPGPASGDQDAGASHGTPLRVTFGDAELTGRLDNNATARDLAAQLPLTLTFRDHNDVEKTAPLPRELSLEGAPEGHDPEEVSRRLALFRRSYLDPSDDCRAADWTCRWRHLLRAGHGGQGRLGGGDRWRCGHRASDRTCAC